MILPFALATVPSHAVELPMGSAPPALTFPHFPNRLYAFVWRNWQLVPADRMARVVRTSRQEIVRIGRSMGLEGPPRISRDQLRRSYVTIIRRNWHLLPYDQLLQLLDWTPEQLAYTLREDDFLFAKLGNLKPQCEPILYSPPDEHTQREAARIRELVRREFPGGLGRWGDPPFSFVKDLSSPFPAPEARAPSSGVSPRFCHSYFGLYGDPFAGSTADSYPDGYLARLAAAGVDGVWVHAVLSKLHPFPWEPSLSAGYQQRLANLRRLVMRAKRYGIGVYLYLNEPRAMPAAFFAQHPELKGAPEGDWAALCTSVPEVRQWLTEAVAAVCKAAPDLAGFFTITMSENLTNCWSHHGSHACPRCSQRTAPEVLAEVCQAFQDGIVRSGGRQRLIVWDWAWANEWALDAIARLPDGVAFMSVSEWDLPINRGGVATTVGEYSLSAVGPGPRAVRHWAAASRRRLQTFAKVQAAVTWELAAVPYIPAVRLSADHAYNLRSAGINGIMLGWSLGGYPSPNLEVVQRVLDGMSQRDALIKVAARRFGKANAERVVAAWERASDGFQEFPFHIGVAYQGPQHAGPSNLLWLRPTGYRSTMVGFPYDDLDGWRAVYPPEVFIGQLRKTAQGFAEAADLLARTAGGQRSQAVRQEIGLLRACALHFGSSADQAEFVLLRNSWAAAPDDEKSRYADRMVEILHRERDTALRLYQLQMADARLGFEATNHYFYVPLDLAEKVLNCDHLLRELTAASR